MRSKLTLLVTLVAVLATGAPVAQAAGPPEIVATWVTTVTSSSANLRAEIDANGESTTYRFEVVPTASFLVSGFNGAIKAPLVGEAGAGSSEVPIAVLQHVGGLAAATSYRYRVVATNLSGSVVGPPRPLQTDGEAATFSLPDGRGWELVSPLDKNGGGVAAPETLFGGGVFQAAAQGGAITYGSAFSFGSAQGAPGASQYLSRRSADGWSTENVTVPLISGSYPWGAESGVPYQLFTGDLESALLSDGKRCRGDATECPVANPPLPGSGAPAGYRNFYLRNSSGAFTALLRSADVAGIDSADFEVALAGASADLQQVVLSSCSALTADASEVPVAGGGCDSSQQNLYRWSSQGLALVNTAPGAALAAQSGAISSDGSRVYWVDQASGDLYLREGGANHQVDETVGGGGLFQLTAADGSVAFFTKAEHLYRYTAPAGAVSDLTPAGGVQGVLGGSADGSRVYYLTTGGLFLWNQGATVEVADGADSSDYPPATGTARVSPDGTRLVFLSSAQLTEYENRGNSEVYVYSALGNTLVCASCNPSGELPVGPSSIPGAIANGADVQIYKPRVLAADGTRLFFDSSDSLVPLDGNGEADVYQWEAPGTGSCARPGGCLDLISSGRGSEGATFLDASADGSDAYFLTADASLVPGDPGGTDVYDARVGGGFPVPETPIPCVGDACQAVPGQVEDPTPATVLGGAGGNPPLAYPKTKKKHHKKHHHKKKRHHHKRSGAGHKRAGAGQGGSR